VSRINIAVAVAEDARSRIHEVAADCRALGLEHTLTLAVIGVVTGSMESRELRKLWAVPGVLAVELKNGLQSEVTARLGFRECGD
jgi:hypothetical protein